MNDIASAKASFAEQAVIFERKHNWIMCWLYTGTFGSFIGYSAGFPLLAKTQFPAVDALPFVFLGPLVGALSRSATGWVSDNCGGGRVTIWVFVLMMVGVLGVLYFLGIKDQPDAFWGFFAMFLVLFFATGVGNASTFQMIPNIMRKEIDRLMPQADARDAHPPGGEGIGGDHRLHLGDRGLRRLLHPEGLRHLDRADRRRARPRCGASSSSTSPAWSITWGFYTRRGGLLYDVERGTGAAAHARSTPRPPVAAQPAE